eukprot:scaffold1247_cov251-Pinguiococcus_pyrenoidosus.AAC.17
MPRVPALPECLLVALQEALEQKTGRENAFVNLSLTETIHSVVALAALPPEELNRSRSGGEALTPEWCHNEAAQIAKRFGVSDKRLWRIRIKAMVRAPAISRRDPAQV